MEILLIVEPKKKKKLLYILRNSEMPPYFANKTRFLNKLPTANYGTISNRQKKKTNLYNINKMFFFFDLL